jgi:iron complex outermembrane receptor protein
MSDALMVYGAYSQGFKSGGFNRRYNSLLQADGSPLSYDEETADSFELGFKSDPSDTVRLNGAVFSNKYEDIQLSYRVGPAPLLFNAGEATINGAELELFYVPSDRLIIDASVGILDAELDVVSTVPDLGPQTPTATTQAGDKLPRAPDSEFHLGASYIFNIGSAFQLTPRLDLTRRDSIFFDAANGIGEGSTTLVNGSLTLANADAEWRLTLRGENLTDQKYLLAGTTSASTATGYTEGIFARPRNFSLVLTKDF